MAGITAVNSVPFVEIARKARVEPGIWFSARVRQSTANLVTRIRKGLVADFPPDQFEASSTSTVLVGSKRVYSIDVRYIGEQTDEPITPTGVMKAIRENWVTYDHLSFSAQRNLELIIKEALR